MSYSHPISMMTANPNRVSTKDKFAHAMRREIYEQPEAIAKTVERHLKDDIIFPGELQAIESALLTFEKLIIAARGSSRHAGLAGEIMIEDLSGVAVDVEYASEYCYRSTHAAIDPIVIVITQSGETADTIAAQREALTRGVKTIGISNVDGTTIVREASAALITGAGHQELHNSTHRAVPDGAVSGSQARPHDLGGHPLLPAASDEASRIHRAAASGMG